MYLVIDRVTASRLGIAPATIDNTLYDAFGQRQINTMYTQVNQYHVVLESAPGVPAGSRQAEPPVHPVQCVGRGNRRRGPSSFASSGASAAGSNALTTSALYTPSANTLTPPVNALSSGPLAEQGATPPAPPVPP